MNQSDPWFWIGYALIILSFYFVGNILWGFISRELNKEPDKYVKVALGSIISSAIGFAILLFTNNL